MNGRPRLVRPVVMVAVAMIGASCRASTGTNTPTPSIAPVPSGVSAPAPAASPSGTVLRFHPATFHLSRAVEREVGVDVDGRVFLAGGLGASGASSADVTAVDVDHGTVRGAGTVPQAFHDAAGGVIEGRVTVFGGGAGQASPAVQSFDPATGVGHVEGSMPRPLSDLSGAEINGTTYLVGGYDGAYPQRTIYATTDGVHFRVAGTLPVGLRYPAVTAVGDDLLIAGGDTAAGPSAGILRFRAATGSVAKIGHLRSPVAHAMAFTLGGLVYVAGGRTSTDSPLRSVESIDLRTGTVRAVTALPRPLADAAVVVVDGRAWIFGGWRGRPVAEVLVASVDDTGS